MPPGPRPEPFSTFVVGSLPRPQWVRDVIMDRKACRISYEAADRELDAAVPSAVRLQERAGLDYVSDGEWRRESYVKVFTEHVSGFDPDRMTHLIGSLADPVVTTRIEQTGDIAAGAAGFLRRETRRKTIVALPSPYILGWRMWRADLSSAAYPAREEFMQACVPILRAEIAKLATAGIDHIQIDEPWLLMMGDPEHRERLGVDDLAYEIDLSVKTVNAALEGSGGIESSMHLCHGHFDRIRATEGGYEPIIEALGDINVGRFAMAFAAPQSHGLESLSMFPSGKILGLGVIDHCDPIVETPEVVVERAEAALKYVDAQNMTINPDCGFSPGAQNPMDLDEAYAKLTAMCEGAATLRKRHGGE
jgi:5-methyltetrahydropteroyltriglutamate--homocysteine methyltransferase